MKEGLEAQSKRDFLNKMNIALKEASETEYWLELLVDTGFIDKNVSVTILEECRELNRILSSIVKTTKTNLRKMDN